MSVCCAFDIGNVLCHFDINIFNNVVCYLHSTYLNSSAENKKISNYIDYIQKYQDLGITTVGQSFTNKFKRLVNYSDEITKAWNDTLAPSEMMLNELDKLREEGIKIALLSNMGHEHLSHLREICPRMFKDTIQHISCEVGARKPSKLFFQSFLMDHEEFKGCVYIDDLNENLQVGKKYSFKTCQFDLKEQSKLSLSQQKQELDRIRKMILNKI